MQHINEDIKTGRFKQVYLLHGEERYLRRQYRDRLKKAMCSEGDTMNVHFYEGKDISVGEVIDQAEVLPFFAERRVILIENSGLFKSGGERLADYLAEPGETSYFIFNENEVDKRSRLYKTVQSKGYIADFGVQDENTLKRWIAGILKREGKRITVSTAELFLEKTGTDMDNIYMELEKLISYCLDKPVVEAQDVEAVCSNRTASHIFDMINAIAAGQSGRAFSLYNDLLTLKEPPMRILSLLTRQYNMLLQVKELKEKGFDHKAIGARVGLSPYIVGKYVTQASRFRQAQLRKALAECAEAEEAVKNGKMNDVMSVEVLMMSMLQRKAYS